MGKLKTNWKLTMLFKLPIFWAVFKTLKQMLRAFIRVSGSFIAFDPYFKALSKATVGKGFV